MSFDPELQKASKLFQETALLRNMWRACPNCQHWDKAGQKCNKVNARPPAEIIVIACECWENYMPF